MTSGDQSAAWLINGKGPHAINAIRDGNVTGYTAALGSSNNLIVENIMMNDSRNNSKLQCVIIKLLDKTINRQNDLSILNVAGEWYYVHTYVHYQLTLYLRMYVY